MVRLLSVVHGKLRRALFSTRGGALLFKLMHPRKTRFSCPICRYHGPFCDDAPLTGRTYNTHCPSCGSNVRMRLQWLAIESLRTRFDLSKLTVHHFSPEKAMSRRFRSIFGRYLSAGLTLAPVDCPADLTALPFANESCDFIFASHVLEHIKDDAKAISEIARVLKPGGIAVLPVPIGQERTVEYAGPNPKENGHVRAPGLDYFDRYRKAFARVEVIGSEDFAAEYQLWDYDDRTRFPTPDCPLKRPMAGDRHSDYVPICYR
jgi:SAM-dependent methyltransferase